MCKTLELTVGNDKWKKRIWELILAIKLLNAYGFSVSSKDWFISKMTAQLIHFVYLLGDDNDKEKVMNEF